MYYVLMFLAFFGVSVFGTGMVQTIVNPSNLFSSGYAQMVQYDTTITRYLQPTPENLKLLYRIYRYGPVTQNSPLLVQVHEWGGNFGREESIASFITQETPFVMLAFQFENADDNISNWWYGTCWTHNGTEAGIWDTSYFYPWTSNAIMGVIRRLKTTDIVQTSVQSTIDTNRIYLCGHSIGGTGAIMLGLRHPEMFAGVYSCAGWTTFDDIDRSRGIINNFRQTFNAIIGSIAEIDRGYPTKMPDKSVVFIRDSIDLPPYYLQPLSSYTFNSSQPLYHAYQYTDLKAYFEQIRNPGYPSPFVYFGCGNEDDIDVQGDNIQPTLESQKRGYIYARNAGGHTAGGVTPMLNYLVNFRKNQSYLAFTNRNYGNNSLSSVGCFNDLGIRSWDPTSIVDETGHYYVKLVGTGTSDVTLRNLQNLTHTPGTAYNLLINGTASGQVVADQYGLVSIPGVVNNASIDLTVSNTGTSAGTCVVGAVQITATPNPFNPALTISVAGMNSAKLQKVMIFDLSGRMIVDLSNKIQQGVCAWNVSGYPSGVYIVKVNTESQIATKRISLLK